jgi:ATP-dependent exoDNAse (exonuclease V) beta subunit
MNGRPVKWTKDQQAVFRFEANLCVLAGAGSGKTMTLVELVLRLLAGRTPHMAERVRLQDVLALTYTEKAAREMRERLRLSLNRMIRDSSGRPDERLFWLGQRRQLDRAQIGTIHGFCRRLLKEHAFEAGLDPDFRILEEDGDLQEATLRDLLLEKIAAQDPDLLSLLAYVPWLGGGRRTGLDWFLAALAGQGRTLGRVLRSDFRAARDASAALTELRQAAALAAALIQEGRIPPDKNYFEQVSGFAERMGSVRGEADLAQALPDLQAVLSGNWYAAKAAKDQALEALSALRAELDLEAALPLKARLLDLAGGYETAFARAKAARYSLDFDDLLLETRDLLAANPAVRGRLKSRFRVLLVDEFQDTNRLQAEILAYLLEPVGQGGQPPADVSALEFLAREDRKLVVFGDPKQSIYRFRGADVSVFNRLRASLTAASADPPGQVVPLSINFRSCRPLVEFYNAFFSRVMQHGADDFQAAYGSDDRQRPARGPVGDVTGAAVEILEYEAGEKAAEDREKEAEAVAWRIAGLLAEGRPPVTNENRPPGPGDVTILLRRFTYLDVYEQALRRAGLPFYTVRGRGFYRCQEVWDLLNLIFFLADPKDGAALLGLLRSPLAGLSDETLTRLVWPGPGLPQREFRTYFTDDPAPEPPDLSPGQDQAFRRIQDCLRLLIGQKAGRAFVAELIETAVEETDYLAALMALPEGTQKAANVQRFIEIVRRLPAEALFAPMEAARYFRRRLDGAEADPEAALSPEGSGAVQIMTIHQAKGLEFPIVFVPDAGQPLRSGNARLVFGRDGAFGLAFDDPESGERRQGADFLELREEEKRKEEAEHLRLLYVAATRAQDWLVFSGHALKKSLSKSWRGLLDDFAKQHPEMIQVRQTPAEGRAGPRPLPPPPPESASLPRPGPTARALVARALDRPSLLPRRLAISVTDLGVFFLCPRRYFLESVLRLPAQGQGKEGEQSGEGRGLKPDQKGTLLHALLEAVDLTRSVNLALLKLLAEQAARRAGIKLPAGEDEVLAGLTLGFLESAWGRDLTRSARAGQAFRELPFSLSIVPPEEGGPRLTLAGVIDLFYITPEGRARLVDYKYSPEPKPERYAPQLACYALALRRSGRAEALEAGLYFTHEQGSVAAPMDLLPGWETRLEKNLGQAALELARLHGTSPSAPIPPDPCPDAGCGLAHFCFGSGEERGAAAGG